MKTITINLNECTVYLRTTINTLEVKENKKGYKYIPLSYDIKKLNDDMASYRLKVYLNCEYNFQLTEDFDMNKLEEKAKKHIQSFINDNIITLQERHYLDNTYYTLYRENKGRKQFWNE